METKLLHERIRECASEDDGCPRFIKMLGKECKEFDSCLECNDYVAFAFADEIERQYIPRPRYEDGELVAKGCEVDGGIVYFAYIRNDGFWVLYDEDGNELQSGEAGDYIKRPAPKVLDADGVEIKAGDTVYSLCDGDEYTVLEAAGEEFGFRNGANVKVEDGYFVQADILTHERPVFGADGLVIKEGDTVYSVYYGDSFTVESIGVTAGETLVHVRGDGDRRAYFNPLDLTHSEPDSLEKLWGKLAELSEWDGEDCPVMRGEIAYCAARLKEIMERSK